MALPIFDLVHIDKDLQEELRKKQEVLNNSFFSEELLKEATQEALQRDALNHSYWMEVAHSEDREQTEEAIYQAHKKGIEDIVEAWEFGKTLDMNRLDTTDIESINGILYPFDVGVRRGMARVKGSQVSRPNAARVHEHMDHFCQTLHMIDDPVKKALYIQSRLLFIHPFNDGNGRTARLISNLVLRENGYTPIKLSKEEKAVYVDLLELGFREYAKREASGNPNALMQLSSEEVAYFDFLAGKLNTNMSNAIRTLGDIKELHIEPSFVGSKTDEGLYRMIVKQLHLLREDNPVVEVHYDPKTRDIYVKGNVDVNSIDMLFKRNRLIRNYKVTEIK